MKLKNILYWSFWVGVTAPAFAQVKYVTTIHPFQAILQELVAERAEVMQILPPGASPHTFQLRPSDLRKVESARALFYGGTNLDSWAKDFHTPHRIELISLIPQGYLLPFNQQRDMKKEIQSKYEKRGGSRSSPDGVDPHFWSDPVVVKALVGALKDTLSQLDPSGREIYNRNASRFSHRLDSLTVVITRRLLPVQNERVMLSHPFFRYFFHRFHLDLVAVVERIPGREAPAKELRNLIQLAKRRDVSAIFCQQQLRCRAARSVAEAVGIRVYQLDPIGGPPGRDTYEELLLHNTTVILEALR